MQNHTYSVLLTKRNNEPRLTTFSLIEGFQMINFVSITKKLQKMSSSGTFDDLGPFLTESGVIAVSDN